MDFNKLQIFNDKLYEVETRFCAACNYSQQSQKGHTCWNGFRHIINDDKYGYANFTLEELLFEKKISKDDILIIKEILRIF